MRGGTMSGNCATGRPSIAMRPPRTVRIAMTIATMGLLMKNRAMASPPGAGRQGRRGCRRSRRGIDGRDGHARLHAGEPLDDDTLALGESALDDPHASHALGGLDCPDLSLVAFADDRDLIRALHLVDRALGNEDRP